MGVNMTLHTPGDNADTSEARQLALDIIDSPEKAKKKRATDNLNA